MEVCVHPYNTSVALQSNTVSKLAITTIAATIQLRLLSPNCSTTREYVSCTNVSI